MIFERALEPKPVESLSSSAMTKQNLTFIRSTLMETTSSVLRGKEVRCNISEGNYLTVSFHGEKSDGDLSFQVPVASLENAHLFSCT